jgi:hypothetical protein
MKHHCLFIAALMINCGCFSQSITSAFKIQSDGTERGTAICTDNSGNAITTGWFSGPADFDPSAATFSLTPNGGSTDIYLAKYDASLNYIWAIRLGGSQVDNSLALATDASDNIIVAGDFAGSMNLNGTFTPSTTINSLGSSDRNGFIAKYDASGTLKWGKSIGGVNKDIVQNIKTDAAENIYVTGYFGGIVDFDQSTNTFTLASNGGRDIFLAKYDAAGNFVWAFNVGGTISTAYEEGGQDLSVTGQYIYLTGNFEGTADFDPGAGTSNLVSNGSLDVFVAKYDTDGKYQWALGAGSANKHDFSYAIDLDANENVYISGGFEETADFDPSASTATLASGSVSAQDIFVAKYTSSGSFMWAIKAGGSSLVDDHAYDMEVTPQGDVFITGEVWGPADFDPSSGTANISTSNDQIFIARYSSGGNYVWAFEIGSTSGNGPADNGFGIHLANNGVLYVTGDFTGTADFDPGFGTTNLAVNNQGHAFVAAYGPAIVVGADNNELSRAVQIFPNPSHHKFLVSYPEHQGDPWSISITDLTGKQIFVQQDIVSATSTVDLTHFKQGLYFCTINCGKVTITKKLVIE